MSEDKYLLSVPAQAASAPVMTEITRSFTYRLNVGNYESRDFFCSQKAQCPLADAETVSDQLYQFCKSQVLKAVKDYTAARAEQQSRKQVA